MQIKWDMAEKSYITVSCLEKQIKCESHPFQFETFLQRFIKNILRDFQQLGNLTLNIFLI
jgi:hypothetical protein